MEGVLYKWTNYMTGWQPRWFVLDDGILSYYDSQEDVCKGSKGSIKMSVCEIKVHPSDSSRVELIIPGEQHFYVKAVNAAERQRWLVALGSSKAGLLYTGSTMERELTERTDSLRTKMSELRLYCDLLVQQVHTLQHSPIHDITSCCDTPGHDIPSCADQPSHDIPSAPASPSSETRQEASSLLRATCSTFLRTLEECMTLANTHLTPPPDSLSPVSPSPLQMARVRTSEMKRSISHPGTYSSDRSVQRRTRTCSDTEAACPHPAGHTDRALPGALSCLKPSVNGDSAPCIPEESRGGASPRATPDTDAHETDVSI
ncbi:pleckstrin homology domain-containing family A member 3 isoform X1 [Osmerus mordax]|uniref:pleckstrin homology domain-containing family A member 3 isoform X1 n=1 Tax=Osmerus mordax TaxID=8014 RepID=UPI00350F5615